MAALVFSVDAGPKAILDAAGIWLSDKLGWRWVKSRRWLEERRDEQVHELHLQPSVWNRTGVATSVAPRVSLYDDRVRQWRAVNPEAALTQAHRGRYGALAYTTLLVNIDAAFVSVELSGLPQSFSSPSLEALHETMAKDALPVLRLFGDPHSLPDRLPQRWLSMIDARTVEWLLARAGNEAAARFIQRYLDAETTSSSSRTYPHKAFREGCVGESTSRGREEVRSNALAELGWLGRVHGLVEPVDG
jgi:hypothetical protein